MFLVLFSLLFATNATPADDFHAAARQTVTIESTGRSFVSPRSTRKPWDGYFSAQNFTKPTEKTALEDIKKNLQKVVIALPREHTAALKSLEVKNQYHVSRGLANSKKIIINTGNIDNDNELKAVFVHELGHVVDLGQMKGTNLKKSEFVDGKRPIWTDDPSLIFYRLSWQNSDARRAQSSKHDFVSGYAMSTPFEDFAEHYVFYRLHGDKFRAATAKSQTLGKKYAFMRDKVFAGQEFQTDRVAEFVPGLIWDTTLLSFDNL